MKKIKNIHGGEILREEFLVPMNLSVSDLSNGTGIPQTEVSNIIEGNSAITHSTALSFSKYFGNSKNFWLGIQRDFDLEEISRR